jgi:hypothetical protein
LWQITRTAIWVRLITITTTNEMVSNMFVNVNSPAVVRALSQLLEEYEYHTAHTKNHDAKAPITFSSYTPSGSRARVTATTAASDNDPVKPAIRKVGGLVVYDYLQQPLLCIVCAHKSISCPHLSLVLEDLVYECDV